MAEIDIRKVRSAIPSHCFEINTCKSFCFMFRDIFLVAFLYALRIYYLEPFVFSMFITLVTKIIWWNAVGFMFWACFVIGHDAGHGTFSRSSIVNSIVGHIMHTPILVPFHGWKQSHLMHHMYHNDLARDKTWRPLTYDHVTEWESTTIPGFMYRIIRYSPICLLLFPYYLLASEGPLTYGNHFNPFNKQLFPSKKDKFHGAVSAVFVITFFGCIVRWVIIQSDVWLATLFVLDWYFVPYWIFTVWLSLVTYLHHTSPESRFFRKPDWTFLKGAETTIDRNYGFIINYLHHNIETHFIHHIFFTKIPHYHLVEATEAAKPILANVYKYDGRNPLWTFITEIARCYAVPNEGTNVGFMPEQKIVQ